MSRILITGIEGFAGGHLARRLLGSGHEVSGIYFATPPAGLDAHLFHGDVCDFDRLREVFAETRPEQVVHLAALSSVAESENQALRTWDVNATGTLRLFEALLACDLHPRVLLISSANVYGPNTGPTPLSEESPTRPAGPYALSKVGAEQVTLYYHHAHGFDVVILRPFSHTGPGQSPVFVFPSAAERIARMERDSADDPDACVLKMGNLDVQRDYADVRDVVRAYELALDRCVGGEVYNVTSGNATMIRDGIELLCSFAKCPVRYESAAEHRRARDFPLLTGDPAKFAAATGWHTELPFEQTLRDLLDWYRTRTS